MTATSQSRFLIQVAESLKRICQRFSTNSIGCNLSRRIMRVLAWDSPSRKVLLSCMGEPLVWTARQEKGATFTSLCLTNQHSGLKELLFLPFGYRSEQPS